MRGVALAEECDFPAGIGLGMGTAAAALLALGREDEADRVHAAAAAYARQPLIPMARIGLILLEAFRSLTAGDLAPGRDRLREGLGELGRRGMVIANGITRRMMARLCAIALEEDIEAGWVVQIISRLRLAPPADHLVPEWPAAIRIITLGRFEIRVADRALEFGRKAPKVPLRILKLLAAHGRAPMAQTRILDALWPETDGDAARRSFDVALHRLRKLLGDPGAVVAADGMLSLDLGRVSVDAFALAQVAARVERASANDPRLPGLAESLLGPYGGPFLPADEDLPGATGAREDLRRGFVHSVRKIGDALEARGDVEAARSLYVRALKVADDDLLRFRTTRWRAS